MLFRIPASHSQPLFCLALPHVFLSSSILKGGVTCTTHFSCLPRTLTWTFLSCCRFWTVVRLCHWASNGWHLRWSLEDQSGGKKFNLGKVVLWNWFHWCNGSWTGRRDLNQMQRKVEIRGIPKHVEMLFGKTAYAYSVAEMLSSPTCIRVHLHQFAFHECDLTSWLKGSFGLPPAICPLSAPLHPNSVPSLFVFPIDPF